MFNGILSDVFRRDGHVGEARNGNNSNNNNNISGCGGGGAGDSCSELSRYDWTRDVAVFERHVTHYNNDLMRMRDPAAVVTSSQSVSCRSQCDKEVDTATDIAAPTSVSCRPHRMHQHHGN